MRRPEDDKPQPRAEPSAGAPPSREARLAEALRANLRRRKAAPKEGDREG